MVFKALEKAGCRWRRLPRCLALLLAFPCLPAAAAGEVDLLDLSLEELLQVKLQVGSRTVDNRLGRATVPVDIISGSQLRRSGYTELPKALNHLVPAFTYAFATIDDLTDHVRPFTLNGLKADQVLVLINGKRLHQGASVYDDDSQVRGGTAVDLSLIAMESIDRIELLRDDASALYGSDAIAGVINVVLKQQSPTEVLFDLGQRSAGDGRMAYGVLNHGGDDWFLSLELRDKQHSNTSGLDRRDYYFEGDPRNGAYAVTHRYGDPDHRSLIFTLNGGGSETDDALYYTARWVQKNSEATGFFRRPRDNRTVRSLYPDGYLPELQPRQQDGFATLGYRFSAAGTQYDISNTVGYNHIDVVVANSVNASLGAASPTRFDAGSLALWQNTVNFDVVPSSSHGFNWAWGLEFRREQHEIEAGEWASWIDGGVAVLDGPNAGADTAGGSQLYPGFAPSNANTRSRHVSAAYVEFSKDVRDDLTASLSLRDEYYADFGNTLNGKLAVNFAPSERFNLRAALSTGFRAPALQQLNYYRTSTSVLTSGGMQRFEEVGTFPVDHRVARLLGARDLEPEQSRRASVGFSWQPTSASQVGLDYFVLHIDDRIALSSSIDVDANIPPDAAAFMRAAGISGVTYFLNAVDTRSQGLDLSWRYRTDWVGRPTELQVLYHHGESRIEAIHVPEQLARIANEIFGRKEQERLLNYLPKDKVVVAASSRWRAWEFNARATWFGKTLYVNVENDPSRDQWFSSKATMDLDVAYHWNDRVSLAFGANNLFNTLPDYRRDDPPFNGPDRIFQYRGTSAFDYNGAFFYARLEVAL